MAKRRPPTMTAAVRRAVAAAHWLTDADAAAVDLAFRYAKQLDDSVDETPEAAAKILGWMGPQLTGLLKQIGGTPEGRKALAVEEAQVKGKLAELRAIRGGAGGA